jgi:hypothetical protein
MHIKPDNQYGEDDSTLKFRKPMKPPKPLRSFRGSLHAVRFFPFLRYHMVNMFLCFCRNKMRASQHVMHMWGTFLRFTMRIDVIVLCSAAFCTYAHPMPAYVHEVLGILRWSAFIVRIFCILLHDCKNFRTMLCKRTMGKLVEQGGKSPDLPDGSSEIHRKWRCTESHAEGVLGYPAFWDLSSCIGSVVLCYGASSCDLLGAAKCHSFLRFCEYIHRS